MWLCWSLEETEVEGIQSPSPSRSPFSLMPSVFLMSCMPLCGYVMLSCTPLSGVMLLVNSSCLRTLQMLCLGLSPG